MRPLSGSTLCLGAGLLAACALGVTPEEDGAGVDAIGLGPQLRADGRSITCGEGSLDLRYEPLAAPVPDLQPSADIPLPAIGPDASGTFFAPPGYIEGGTFPGVDLALEAAPSIGHGWLRVAEWNVARGKKLPDLVASMRQVNADVWILNETDLYGGSAGGVVVARELAHALGYSYVTTVEFYERRDDRRGMSGNAIVSRYPLSGARMTYIPMFRPGEPWVDLDGDGTENGDERFQRGYDWSSNKFEPRCGQRSALTATIDVPNWTGSTTRIRLVSLHTENLEDFDFEIVGPRVRRLQFQAVRRLLTVPGEPTMMAGDLNTLALLDLDSGRTETSAFRDFLADELARVGGDPLHGSPRAFVDCAYGSRDLTHGVGPIDTGHLDWILSQEGWGDAVSCMPGTYQVHDGSGSDHKIVETQVLVRRPAIEPTSEPAP